MPDGGQGGDMAKQMVLINGCIIADDITPCFWDESGSICHLRNSRRADGIGFAPDFIDVEDIESEVFFDTFADLMEVC